MLTDWPEEFEEASEQNLADTNLVVNSGQLPVGKKKNIRPLLLCLVNLSSNGIVQNCFIVFVIFQILDLDRYDDKILDKNQNDERPCEVARAEEAYIQSRAIHHRLFAVSTFRGKRACVKANVSMCDLVARQRGTCVTTADPTSLNYAHAPNPGGPNVFCTPCIE